MDTIETSNDYENAQVRMKWMKRLEFAVVQLLRLIVAFIKLVLTMILSVVKGVLKVFGVPIRD